MTHLEASQACHEFPPAPWSACRSARSASSCKARDRTWRYWFQSRIFRCWSKWKISADIKAAEVCRSGGRRPGRGADSLGRSPSAIRTADPWLPRNTPSRSSPPPYDLFNRSHAVFANKFAENRFAGRRSTAAWDQGVAGRAERPPTAPCWCFHYPVHLSRGR